MRLQSTHSAAERGLDAYFSPPEAVHSLVACEKAYIPKYITEPAAGDGAIVKVLEEYGYNVYASDIHDYGLKGCKIQDYLKSKHEPRAHGLITNPPFKLALRFVEKATSEVSYAAFLLRTNFLETPNRMIFFKAFPPSRIWISSRRLPMMHRHGWTGKRSTSNTCFAWFVWDNTAHDKPIVKWFDWKDHV